MKVDGEVASSQSATLPTGELEAHGRREGSPKVASSVSPLDLAFGVSIGALARYDAFFSLFSFPLSIPRLFILVQLV